ncbi:polycystin-2-like [Bacillus rossius redtenbacheri]|uniref:polycystin-2-like n=1 Tax=Bacillus rossius redtenbacheri TaxID=93214 RepID=UPI002FDEDF4E
MAILAWLVKYVATPQLSNSKAFLINMMVYAIYLFVFSFNWFGSMSITSYYFNKHMEKLFVSRTPGLDGIRNIEDFWIFAEGPMLDSLFPEPGEMDGNLIVGGPRLRQAKVRNNSCEVHSHLKYLQHSCYGHYTVSTEDRKTFGPGTTSPWVFSHMGSDYYQGLVTTYGGGGYHLDLPLNKIDALQAIQELRQNNWLTRGTRVVFVDVVVYSVNVDKLLIAKLLVEFPPTGDALPSWFFEDSNTTIFSQSMDYFVFVSGMISMAFNVYFLLLEACRLVYLKLAYFSRFWNYFDFSVAICSIISLKYGIEYYYLISSTMAKLPNGVDIPEFEVLAVCSLALRATTAIALLMSWLKIFYFLRVGSSTLAKIKVSVWSCVLNSLGLFMVFMLLVFAFTHLAHHVLGPHLHEYSTVSITFSSLLRALLWDFDLEELQRSRPVFGPMILLVYLSLVLTVLWSIPLAIFARSHTDVMSEISRRCNLWDQWKEMVWGQYSYRQGKVTSEEELRLLLEQEGLTDEDMAAVLSRMGVRRGQHVDSHHLRNALGCLQDAEMLPESAVRWLTDLQQRVDAAGQTMVALTDRVREAVDVASGNAMLSP